MNSTLGGQQVRIIVEHMEDYLFEWCMHEYLQMKEYIRDSNCVLAITNAKVIYNYQGQYKADNEKNLAILQKQFEAAGPGRCTLVSESVTELVQEQNLAEPVCMLDLRGEKELNPDQTWATLIFGGILGGHPPRDRPAPVRKYFDNIRHLGDIQLATDTAVLVSKLIMHNKLRLGSIPLVREPTIKGTNAKGEKTVVEMEGFGYVSKELDIVTGQMQQEMSKKDKKQIYMSEGVRKLLIQQDLAADAIM